MANRVDPDDSDSSGSLFGKAYVLVYTVKRGNAIYEKIGVISIFLANRMKDLITKTGVENILDDPQSINAQTARATTTRRDHNTRTIDHYNTLLTYDNTTNVDNIMTGPSCSKRR